jgi:hypothetical protein
VVEEVFDGEDAAIGQARGDAVADALDEFDGRGELERHGIDGSSGGCAVWSWRLTKKRRNDGRQMTLEGRGGGEVVGGGGGSGGCGCCGAQRR